MIDFNELEEYIKTFNKNAGEFTDEEIYDIGLKHKSLVCGKDWKKLTSVLGVKKTPEALRRWVYRRQEADGSAKRNPKLLSDKKIEDLNESETADLIQKQIDELYVAKTQVRDSWNAYRRNLREEARVRSMMDSIKEAALSTKELPQVSINQERNKGEVEAILMISDLHIGVNCDNYYNWYNEKIAAERLSKLVSDTIKYCKVNNVGILNVIMLGDLIHGIIHTNARLEQEFDVTSQIMKAAELLTETLNCLQEAAPVITYRSVVDNHSRAVANLNEHIEKENFCKIIDWYVKSKLENSSIKFIDEDNIDDGIGMFNLRNGRKVVFAHGHQDRKSSVMQDMVGLTHSWIDYILLGHYHNKAEHTFQGAKVFVNGSICGTEQYAFGKRLFSKPTQTLLIFDEDNILNIEIKLDD